jgi:hypothetical protein
MSSLDKKMGILLRLIDSTLLQLKLSALDKKMDNWMKMDNLLRLINSALLQLKLSPLDKKMDKWI